ncbi:acetate--CoA ligase [Candidatus Marinimicrobia bacterium]|nr:acetate--CoA ligase [Candidatus Neomarinimicrobiota bacterium]
MIKYKSINQAHVKSSHEYLKGYNESLNDNDRFWSEKASHISWFRKWDKVSDNDFNQAKICWYKGGKLNVSYNCIDRHIENGYGDSIAILWQGNNDKESLKITYNELLKKVCSFSNVLKTHGINKGDRVCIYMQMIPELAIAMLACARIGAIHSVVFGAFSADSLEQRINDSKCIAVITQDSGVRGSKNNIPMKKNVDKAIERCPSVMKNFIVKRTGESIDFIKDRDFWWHEEIQKVSNLCEPEIMDSEDPLFILYTSGSTGQPKGVLHTSGGYLVYASYTHKVVFDYQPNDIYWCTADIGWITGHSYVVYGPLCNGATTLMFEGVPNYPDYGRFWEIVEKYKVNIFYTAPTALRALMKEGNEFVEKYDRSSLKLLGTVGETIKKPEWNWYNEIVGQKKCPIVDTWWQTETGGILISPIPAITDLKPGSATKPFFGINPAILDENGKEIVNSPAEGYLVLKQSWPGQMRTIYGDHKRFYDTYFSQFKGFYFTGDGAKRDEDGYYWITGRVDDVLNVSGHRLGTAEIEGAIGACGKVAEAAVVGYVHEIKGEGIYAYVTLMKGIKESHKISQQINDKVQEIIGPHAKPDKIQYSQSLPKTRSGKIMRRILRKIANGDFKNLGDLSTLSEPDLVNQLIENRIK